MKKKTTDRATKCMWMSGASIILIPPSFALLGLIQLSIDLLPIIAMGLMFVVLAMGMPVMADDDEPDVVEERRP